MDKWDLGYVQHLVSYFVDVDSLTLLITGKIEALKYESLLSYIFPTKITVTSLVDLPEDPPGFRGPELAEGNPLSCSHGRSIAICSNTPMTLAASMTVTPRVSWPYVPKRTGLAFPQTQLFTFLHSNHELCRYRTFQMPQDPVREAKWAFAEEVLLRTRRCRHSSSPKHPGLGHRPGVGTATR